MSSGCREHDGRALGDPQSGYGVPALLAPPVGKKVACGPRAGVQGRALEMLTFLLGPLGS